jgi:hypothetical protein
MPLQQLLVLVLVLLLLAVTDLALHVLYEVVSVRLQCIVHTDTQQPCCCHHQTAQTR